MGKDIFEAAKQFENEHGTVPTRYAFEQGAKWNKKHNRFVILLKKWQI